MLPPFKINNHRDAYSNMDNNLYNTDKDIAYNLQDIYINKNMDSNLRNKDNDIVGIPHSTNIPFVFPFAVLLTKLLNQGMCPKCLVCTKRSIKERGLHLNKSFK